MIFSIVSFNTNKEIRFYRIYRQDIDLEYVKSMYNGKDICIRYLSKFNIVYHRYAGLIVALVVDKDENVLLMSNVITRMIQAFDDLIKNVCEINIIYSFDRIYSLIDGFICDGKIMDMEIPKIASHGKY